jgi:hypothetical protein
MDLPRFDGHSIKPIEGGRRSGKCEPIRKRAKYYSRVQGRGSVRLSSDGIKSVADIPADLGVPCQLLLRWRRVFDTLR